MIMAPRIQWNDLLTLPQLKVVFRIMFCTAFWGLSACRSGGVP
jgi:hypothetical protein